MERCLWSCLKQDKVMIDLALSWYHLMLLILKNINNARKQVHMRDMRKFKADSISTASFSDFLKQNIAYNKLISAS